MSLAKAFYHWVAITYWEMADPIEADADALIQLAVHRHEFEREMKK